MPVPYRSETMKSNVKKLKNCKHMMEVELPPDRVKEEFEKVYQDIGKVASIPGFRPGKAPRDLLEKHFGKTAQEEVIKKLIPETYRKILEEHKLDPIGYPDISDVKLDSEGFSYKASIEIRPKVQLKKYKGLKLKKKIVDVKEEDVVKNLEYLRELHGQKVPKKEGEEKETVLPQLDDEFAKDVGFENLEKLKESIRQNLKARLESEAESDVEMQLISQLLDMIDFEIPETLVNSEKERLLHDADMRLKYIEALQKKGDSEKKFELTDKDKKELEENAYKQAVRQVKAFFILDSIAQAEKIYVDNNEFEHYIGDMAGRYKKTKTEMRDYLEKHHLLDEIAVNLRNRKVMELLLKEAKTE